VWERTFLDVEGAALLTVGEVRDRATVFLDGDPVGVLDHERQDQAIMLPRGRGRLEIVVENQGLVNSESPNRRSSCPAQSCEPATRNSSYWN
jgi:hypothetical protein